MRIDELAKEIKSTKTDAQKMGIVKKHVVNSYCPIAKKYAVLRDMQEKSIIEENNGIKYIEMTLHRINFTLAIVILYTDLELLLKEDGTVDSFGSYDCIMENEIIPKIITIIGEVEYTELECINKAIIETFDMKNNSFKSFMSDTIQNFGIIVGVLADDGFGKLEEIVKDENKMKKFEKELSSFLDKYVSNNKLLKQKK